ncbi:MAG: hypothetical protein IBX40_04450 [Methanosarcinales archaeon]|nr:hypothetical protein [Methanosarcinales archaeon]
MEFNESILHEVMEAAKTGPIVDRKIALYSQKASVLLRYLELSNPKFSRGGAAGEMLTLIAPERYPELWGRIVSEVQAPREKKKSEWAGKAEQLKHPDSALMDQALAETQTRKGRIITVYSPRLAALFRYLDHTIPRFRVSNHAAEMLEEILAREYPEMWERIVECTAGE